jgi:hypothetical protein
MAPVVSSRCLIALGLLLSYRNWDTIEAIPPRAEWKNANGGSGFLMESAMKSVRQRLRADVVPVFVLVLAIALPGSAVGQSTQATVPAPAPACDRQCLRTVMDDFVKAMAAGKTASVPLGQQAEVRENTKLVTLDATAWKQVKAVRSLMIFADHISGNVVSRAGVELADGKAGYISTRLKVAAQGRITDVEMSSDVSPRVVSAYVWNLDPQLTAAIPPEQRMTRVALEALGRRYFHALSTHQPVAADFDDASCNRFHSGQQITNAGNSTVESGPPRTCVASMNGDRPWGPATEQRFPVIDEEQGIVFGVTLLHYLKTPNQSVMYVSEIFKVVGGKIVKIDNIGLMMQGVGTLGFVH